MLIEVVRWTMIALVLLCAAIGFLILTRGTAVRRARSVGTEAEPVAAGESEFPRSVAVLTGGLVVAGNRVELALDGDGTFDRLWADLQSVEQSITVQMYYASGGCVADRLRELLVDRARTGVQVLLLFDAFGADRVPRAYWKSLREAGVRAVAFRPLRPRNLWVVQNRSHVRGGGAAAPGRVRRRVGRGDRGAGQQPVAPRSVGWWRPGRRAAVHRADARQHPGRALPRTLDRGGPPDAVRHERLLRARPELHRAVGGGRAAGGGRPRARRRPAHRSARGAVGGAGAL